MLFFLRKARFMPFMNKSLDTICKLLEKQRARASRELAYYKTNPGEGSTAVAAGYLDDLNDVRNGLKQLATTPSKCRNGMQDSFGFLVQRPDWAEFCRGRELPIYGLDNLPGGEILVAEISDNGADIVRLPVIANYITALDGRETLWENDLFALDANFKRMPLARYFYSSASSLREAAPGIIIREGVEYFLHNAERALEDWAKNLKA